MPLQPVSIVMKLVSPQSCRTRIAEAAEDGMGWASTPKLTTNLGLQEARKVPQCTGSVASDDGRHSATWIVKSWQWLCRPWREDLFWCLDVQSRQYFHNVHHCSSLFKELSNETNHRDNNQVRMKFVLDSCFIISIITLADICGSHPIRNH
jgi:hypothetical protein